MFKYLLVFAVVVWSNPFEVKTLEEGTLLRVDDNILIESVDQTQLLSISSNSLTGSSLYLRRKFSQNSYALFNGRIKANKLSQIYAFSRPEGISDADLVRIKFYRKHKSKAFQDERDIYFDQKFLYSSNLKALYYKYDSKWFNLASKPIRFGSFKISQPKGADLFVDGQKLGSLPYSSSPLTPGFYHVTLKQEQKYSHVVGFSIESGENTFVKPELLNPIQLVQKEKVFSPTVIKGDTVLASKYNNLDSINLILQSAYESVDSLTSTFENNYPKVQTAPTGIDDLNDPGFIRYKAAYLNIKKKNFLLSVKPISNQIAFLEKKRKELKVIIDKIEMDTLWMSTKIVAHKSKLLDSTKMEWGLKLKLLSSLQELDVIWKGTIQSKDSAILDSLKEAQVNVLLQNKGIFALKNNTKWRKLYRLFSLQILLKDSLYTLNGSFTLPPHILQNQEVQDWLKRDSLAVLNQKMNNLEQKKQFEIEKRNQKMTVIDSLKNLYRGKVTEIPGGEFKYKGKTVEISPFAINTFETTQSHFKRFTDKTPVAFQSPLKPMHSVTWEESQDFCESIGGSLPTEAQWELAARVGQNLSDASEKESVYGLAQGVGPVSIGTMPANSWGLSDMSGNVSEWVYDYYSLFYLDIFTSSKDPLGPRIGLYHFKVYKGASWKTDKFSLNLSNQNWEDPRFWSTDLGFRCAFEPYQKFSVEGLQAKLKGKLPKSILKKKTDLKPLLKEVAPSKALDSTDSKPLAAIKKDSSSVKIGSSVDTTIIDSSLKPSVSIEPSSKVLESKTLAVDSTTNKVILTPEKERKEVNPSPIAKANEVEQNLTTTTTNDSAGVSDAKEKKDPPLDKLKK